LTDRPIIYPVSLPRSEDLLTGWLSNMTALGMLMRAIMGANNTVVDGFQVTPTSPASLSVTVGQGSIISPQVVDETAYGSLSANSNPLLKIGTVLTPTTLTLTAPTTPGQSITYLIEVSFLEQDVDPIVLAYYNSAGQPYSGPSNSGTAQNTLRQQTASLQLKSGGAGNTGSQPTPSADSGWYPLWYITVNYGQTAITSTSIIRALGAPYLPNTLPGLRIPVVGGTLNLFVNSSGGSDSNTGTTAQYPFLTIQGAITAAATNYDLTGTTVQINVAAGSYAGFVVDATQIKAHVSVVGAGSGSTTVTSTSSNSIAAVNGGSLTVSNIAITNTSGNTGDYSGGNTGLLSEGSTINIGAGVNFGACSTGPHMWANQGGAISTLSASSGHGQGYTISGGATSHVLASGNGNITIADATITLTNTPNFSQAFANAQLTSSIGYWNNAFVGSATGSRYFVSGSSAIDTQGAGANYLPGSTAGSSGNGGVYY
jgi:hypothetical protein